jgi:hypothetical protein
MKFAPDLELVRVVATVCGRDEKGFEKNTSMVCYFAGLSKSEALEEFKSRAANAGLPFKNAFAVKAVWCPADKDGGYCLV